jgi:hypothetical protein
MVITPLTFGYHAIAQPPAVRDFDLHFVAGLEELAPWHADACRCAGRSLDRRQMITAHAFPPRSTLVAGRFTLGKLPACAGFANANVAFAK